MTDKPPVRKCQERPRWHVINAAGQSIGVRWTEAAAMTFARDNSKLNKSSGPFHVEHRP
jgi:hypothetical protein